MRIYEFRCQKCRAEFEELVRSNRDTPACPKCKSTQVERLLSAVRSQSSSAPAAQTGCATPSGFS